MKTKDSNIVLTVRFSWTLNIQTKETNIQNFTKFFLVVNETPSILKGFCKALLRTSKTLYNSTQYPVRIQVKIVLNISVCNRLIHSPL